MKNLFFLTATLLLGFNNLAHADRGKFCNTREKVIEYVCNERTYGDGWVWQGNGCFHRDINIYCPNPYGRDYPINDNPYNPYDPYDPNPYPAPSCGPNWASMGDFSCSINHEERQRICGCAPEGYRNSTLWVDEHNGCYSHTTGRRCR